MNEPTDQPAYKETDVFLWANTVAAAKGNWEIELFLVSRNYFLYRVKLGSELQNQLKPLFVNGLVEYVQTGAEQGLRVGGFDQADEEDLVLPRVQLKAVENAYITLNWLKTQEHEIESFNEEQHDMKRIKGVMARCKHPDIDQPFFVIKQLPGAMVMKGSDAWLMQGGGFRRFEAEGAVKVPIDNQLLVVGDDMFVFNQTRLEQLFGYNAKKFAVAQQKIKQIEDAFKFTYDGELTMESIVQAKKTLVNKLQNIDPKLVSQADLVAYAEELGIELMTDIDGSIIILDANDMTKFINLLNDDYIESALSGKKYEIKSKKPLKLKGEEQI